MAARSTDGRRYPWGDDPVKWSQNRVFRQIDPVMSFAEDRSPYGIFDLAGNAQEWTRDLYDPRYYHLLAKSIADNPTGPPVSRPQSATCSARSAKNSSVTYREGVPADRRLPYLGFRCVLMVEAQSQVPPTSQPTARHRPPHRPQQTARRRHRSETRSPAPWPSLRLFARIRPTSAQLDVPENASRPGSSLANHRRVRSILSAYPIDGCQPNRRGPSRCCIPGRVRAARRHNG